MTGPVRYVPRTLVDVDAMQFCATDNTGEQMKTWLESFLTIEDDFNYVVFGPMLDRLFLQNGDFTMEVLDGQYVYVDEDGFHVINKGTFETLYKQAPPV